MTFAMNVWSFTEFCSILRSKWKDHLYQETTKCGKKLSFLGSNIQVARMYCRPIHT